MDVSYGNFDITVNKVSTLDSYHTEDLDGVRQFFKENIEPIEDFIYKYDSMDSVYYHIDTYLRNRWHYEGDESKDFLKNDFNLYYHLFAGHLTPQQITHRTVKFENYFPSIQCPVLAVNGTMDDHVDCYPNVARMEQLLNEGGNFNFDKIIVEGFNHGLLDWSRDDYIEENNLVLKIIDWINKQ